MKKWICPLLALVLVLSLTACGSGETEQEEQFVQITNQLGVDLMDIRVSNADDANNSILVSQTFSNGNLIQFSLMDVCGSLEGWVNITASDAQGNLYQFQNAKLYDGIQATMKQGGSQIYIEFPHNGTTAQCSGQIVSVQEPAQTTPPTQPAETVAPEYNAEDFYGQWKYEAYNLWLYIYGDGTYECYDGTSTENGTYTIEDGQLVLVENGMRFYLDGAGRMVDSDGDTLAPFSGSDYVDGAYWGFYHWYDRFLEISEDQTFRVIDYEGEVVDSGHYEYAEGGILLIFQSGTSAFFVLDEEGNLYGGEDAGTCVRVSEDEPLDLPNGGPEVAFQGVWRYPDGSLLQIAGDEWNLYTSDGLTLLMWGPVEYDETSAYLMNTDGSSGGGVLYFDADGNLMDGETMLTYWGEYLFA